MDISKNIVDDCEKVADSDIDKAPSVDSSKNPMNVEVEERVASIVAQVTETQEQVTCTREQLMDVEVEEHVAGVVAQVTETREKVMHTRKQITDITNNLVALANVSESASGLTHTKQGGTAWQPQKMKAGQYGLSFFINQH